MCVCVGENGDNMHTIFVHWFIGSCIFGSTPTDYKYFQHIYVSDVGDNSRGGEEPFEVHTSLGTTEIRSLFESSQFVSDVVSVF